MAAGDAPREDEQDGRGNLSDRALTELCTFFLQVCLDQARYMDEMLALNELVGRLGGYVQLREKGFALSPEGAAAPLRLEVVAMLRAAATQRDIARGEVARLIGMSEQTCRDVLRGLPEEGLLVPMSERGPVWLDFLAHAAGYLFPDLYPAEGHARQTEGAERVMRENREALRRLSD